MIRGTRTAIAAISMTLAAAFLSAPVIAATISQGLPVSLTDSRTSSATSVDTPQLQVAATQALDFKGFDPKLGTLDSVSLSFSGTLHSSLATSISGLGISGLGFIDSFFRVIGVAGDKSDVLVTAFGNVVRADCQVASPSCFAVRVYDKTLDLSATTSNVANYVTGGNIRVFANVFVPSSATLTFFFDTSPNRNSRASYAEDIAITGTATLTYN